jgi:hypothetical protein
MRYYMATNLDGLGWFSQDFRQFIVTASRKLGIEGAMDFAVIRSLLSTARKQGWDILQTLSGQPK